MAYDLSELGILSISGVDAKKLLQGQLTCDVDKLSASQSCLGAHCNPQGRVISLFYIFEYQAAYYLVLPRTMLSVALAALKKYAVFYKAELNDVSSNFILTGWRDTEKNLSQYVALISVPSTTRFISVGKIVAASPHTAYDADFSAWKILDICAGLPNIYPQTSGKFLPHELNLDKLNAISFEKGCYTGQEIIARMHYRGKLKNRLYLAKITSTSTPLPGTTIYSLHEQDQRASGTIVDIAHDENNLYYALLVTDEVNVKSQHLFLQTDTSAYFTFLESNN